MQQSGSVFCEKINEGLLDDILLSNKDSLSPQKRVYYFAAHTTGVTELPILKEEDVFCPIDTTPSNYGFVSKKILQFTKQRLMQSQPKIVFKGAEDCTRRSTVPRWSLLSKSLELVNSEEEIKFVSSVENENLERLNTKTTRELDKYSHYLPDSISEEKAKGIIKDINLKLSNLSFTKLSIELTPSKLMKYRLSIGDNILLTLFSTWIAFSTLTLISLKSLFNPNNPAELTIISIK